MTIKEITPNEYNPYYQPYINKAGSLPLIEGLKTNFETTYAFLKRIPNDKLEFRYADGKWTIKEIILHLIDTERIFAYRALRIARKDKTPLPGFEQDDYVEVSMANTRSINDLLDEYQSVRQATLTLFNSFTDAMLLEVGTASNNNLSVRAVGYITIGHENHHCEVIKERYL